VTVALSGDGGDEMFCGYVRYWATRFMAERFLPLPPALRKALSVGLLFQDASHWGRIVPRELGMANLQDKWHKLLRQTAQSDLIGLYRSSICVWPPEELARLIPTPLPECLFEETFRETEPWPILSRLMRVDQKTYLPDAMLAKVDRASMSASLEVRVPLLDHRVWEFACALPESVKYRNGLGKYLLRRLLRRYLPPSFFERPKMGFAVPIGMWLRGELKGMLSDYLSPERLKAECLFNPDLVVKKIGEHLSGRENHQHPLWALLMWEMWRERWLGRSGSKSGSR
jgi:asparagine synthase (glutamine-hydrolysing)